MPQQLTIPQIELALRYLVQPEPAPPPPELALMTMQNWQEIKALLEMISMELQNSAVH